MQYRLTSSDKKRKNELQLGIILAENLSDARKFLEENLDGSIRGAWNTKDKINILKKVGGNTYETL